jgi:hypothetical protein
MMVKYDEQICITVRQTVNTAIANDNHQPGEEIKL